MQRIYRSRALTRDDDDPLVPSEREEGDRPTSGLSGEKYRTVNWRKLSHAFVPMSIRRRAISVDIQTDAESYDSGTPVHFDVVMRNRAPFPVVLVTKTPVRWEWMVDSLPSASEVAHSDPPPTEKTFIFDRREVKTFSRIWRQRIQTGPHSWRRPSPGEHTIGVSINVPNVEGTSLSAETTINIE